MEKAIYLPRDVLKNETPETERIYIGSHTCAYHMPSMEVISSCIQETPSTLVIPPTPQDELSNMKSHIESFLDHALDPEIVFNDFGIFHWFINQQAFNHVPKILGFLLTHQKRDPYAKLFSDNPLMTALAEDNALYYDWYNEHNLKAIEITNTLQPPTLNSDAPFTYHLYIPYSFVSTSRYCPPFLMEKNPQTNHLPVPCTVENCLRNSWKQEVDVEGHKTTQWYFGNAQWYEHDDIPQFVSRVIDNSLLKIPDATPLK